MMERKKKKLGRSQGVGGEGRVKNIFYKNVLYSLYKKKHEINHLKGKYDREKRYIRFGAFADSLPESESDSYAPCTTPKMPGVEAVVGGGWGDVVISSSLSLPF